jgi:hypothetical protein
VRTKKGKVLTTVKREKPGSQGQRQHAQLILDDAWSSAVFGTSRGEDSFEHVPTRTAAAFPTTTDVALTS